MISEFPFLSRDPSSRSIFISIPGRFVPEPVSLTTEVLVEESRRKSGCLVSPQPSDGWPKSGLCVTLSFRQVIEILTLIFDPEDLTDPRFSLIPRGGDRERTDRFDPVVLGIPLGHDVRPVFGIDPLKWLQVQRRFETVGDTLLDEDGGVDEEWGWYSTSDSYRGWVQNRCH